MKRMVVMFLLMTLILTTSAFSQENETYIVQQGDTGWDLSRQYYDDATVWQRIVDMNPFLQGPGRVFEDEDGRIILIIRPGESLAGLENLGIAPPTAVSIENLVRPLLTTSVTAESEATFPRWIWPVIFQIIFAAFAIAWLSILWQNKREQQKREVRESELRQDPVASGPPIIQGGVRPSDTERLTQAFDELAVADYLRLNPGTVRSTIRVERIGPIETGMISGEGMVGYADGARPRRIDPAQPGYRARFRFPDGREDLLMSLQGCMNPCYFGEGMSGFTFTPREEVVPTPAATTSTPVPVHPTVAVQRVREKAGREGQNTVAVGDHIMVFPQGYHASIDPKTGEVRLEGAMTMTVAAPKRADQTKKTEDKATGTDARGGVRPEDFDRSGERS